MVESLCHGELYHEFKIMGVSVLRHGNIWKPETELDGAVSVTSCNELPAQRYCATLPLVSSGVSDVFSSALFSVVL